MRGLWAAGLPMLAVAAMIALPGAAQARKAVAANRTPPSAPLVLQSALPPDGVIACLSKRDVQPVMLPLERGQRVLLGPGEGWVDLLAASYGSWLRARLWESNPATERWVRSCAAGKPPKPSVADMLADTHWPSPKLPPNRHPSG